MTGLRGLSLRAKLPLTIALLLTIGVATSAVMAARAVRLSLLAVAQSRMQSVAQQIGQMTLTGTVTRERRFTAAAADTTIRRALIQPTAANLEKARVILAGLGPDTGASLGIELRDSTGATLVAATPRPGQLARPPMAYPDSSMTSGLYKSGDTLVTETRSPVRDGTRTIGYVAQVRRATNSTGGSTQAVRDLIGSHAQLLVGNKDGSMWTDLVKEVRRPPISDSSSRYSREGNNVLAAVAPYPHTGMVIVVEFDEAAVLAPLRPLERTFIIVAVLIVVAGTAVGWTMSNSVTQPLDKLTRASEAIATGDLSTMAPDLKRTDEIGRLSRAFASMSDSIRKAQENLEQQVAERTAELHNAQEELVRKERLAILGQLSGGVGHELRNPLGVMTNAVYFLELTQADAPPKVKEYLGILRRQINLSEKIVADLLDFARIKEPQRVPTTVTMLVKEQAERTVLPQNVTIKSEIPANLPKLNVDPAQMGQVVLNLLTNAAQAMEETGGVVTVGAHEESGRIVVTVQDTGPGVAPEHVAKIFEPLYTTKARGIGLGLSVSRGLVRANGGDLRLNPAQGPGATFILELPAVA